MSHPIRKQRAVARGFDSLEGRIVLSTVAATPPPPTLGGTLAQLGVIPANPQALPQAKAGSQLAKDLGKLQADTLGVQANSAATIAEITALRGDDNAIGTTGYKINGQALIKAQTDLALAVIAGNPSTAQAEFTALFGGKVSSTVINKAFADDVAVIRDSPSRLRPSTPLPPMSRPSPRIRAARPPRCPRPASAAACRSSAFCPTANP